MKNRKLLLVFFTLLLIGTSWGCKLYYEKNVKYPNLENALLENHKHFGVGLSKCGPDSSTTPPLVPLSSLSIKTPIFMFDNNGRLLKGDLVSGKWTQISNHGFDDRPNVKPSADGRWISYSGKLKTMNSQQYWLFDKHNGSDRMYLQHPAWGGDLPTFSPDSKTIILYANYDTRWPTPKGTGLYMIDTKTLHSSFLGNPSTVATPANKPYAGATWSEDGSEILLMIHSDPPGATHSLEHFAYRLSQKRFERISGGFAPQWFFSRGGSKIALYKQEPVIQSNISHCELASPSGKWVAAINKTYQLTARGPNGAIKKVNEGTYDDCMGVTIGINGWLDEQHVVYSVAEETYVFDTTTGGNARLFSDQNRPAAYFW